MGKALILSEIGGGYYKIRLILDTSRADAELAAIPAKIEAINERIATATGAALEALQARKLSIQKRQDYLTEKIPEDPEINAWCIDQETGLTGNVGTIEIPGERGTVVIQPGYNGNAVYDSVRDGQLQPAISGIAQATFWNNTILPGWQKFKPTHRFGTITSMGVSTADIALTEAKSSVLNETLDINQTATLDDVTFNYRTGDLSSFYEGQEVIIEFIDQDWEQPQIIGISGGSTELYLANTGIHGRPAYYTIYIEIWDPDLGQYVEVPRTVYDLAYDYDAKIYYTSNMGETFTELYSKSMTLYNNYYEESPYVSDYYSGVPYIGFYANGYAHVAGMEFSYALEGYKKSVLRINQSSQSNEKTPNNELLRHLMTYNGVIYAGFDKALYKSVNDGSTYSHVETFSARIQDLIIANNKFYVALSKENGIYESTTGTSWSLTGTNSNVTRFYGIQEFNGELIATGYYSTGEYGTTGQKIFKLVDDKWEGIGPYISTQYGFIPFFIRKNSQYLFVFMSWSNQFEGITIIKTKDLLTWRTTTIPENLSTNTHAYNLWPFVSDALIVIAGDNGNFYKSTDNCATFEYFNAPNQRGGPKGFPIPPNDNANYAGFVCGPGDTNRVF
jgi:hypothetical protein